jgi:hypothetical protein
LVCGGNGGIDVARIGLGEQGQGFSGGRVDRGKGLPGERIDPAAANKNLAGLELHLRSRGHSNLGSQFSVFSFQRSVSRRVLTDN